MNKDQPETPAVKDAPTEVAAVAPVPAVTPGKQDKSDEFLLDSLRGVPLLDHLAVQLARHDPKDVLTADRWNWVYEEKPGGPLSIYPNRVEDTAKTGLLGRVYTEGHKIVAWEPAS